MLAFITTRSQRLFVPEQKSLSELPFPATEVYDEMQGMRGTVGLSSWVSKLGCIGRWMNTRDQKTPSMFGPIPGLVQSEGKRELRT